MDTDLTAKIPTFNGDVNNFMLWLVRFQLFAVMKKLIGAIQVVGDADLPAEETILDADAKERRTGIKRKCERRTGIKRKCV
jgi:hypothetical protein